MFIISKDLSSISRDSSKAVNGEYTYLQKNKNEYNPADHETREEEFGTIVFGSNYHLGQCGIGSDTFFP